MGSLLELLSGGGSLVDLLRKNPMGGSGNAMSGQVAGAVLPQNQFGQHMTGSPTTTNPMMSSTIGSTATIPAQKQSNRSWEKWAQPQDVSSGLSAAQPDNPMYSQMMQQVMQQQPQQQRQPMASVGVNELPKMPGAIHPNEDMMSLLKRLMGGA
jgi:murein L,D-transpeptidase YcbB/YkuD